MKKVFGLCVFCTLFILWGCTEEIDKSAQEMYDCLINRLKEQYGITEKLKAENQLVWVHMMNEIHQIAEDIVLTELIYN